MFPKSGAPTEIDAHFRALLTISQSAPVRSPLSTIFQSPQVYEPPLKHQVPLKNNRAPMERDAHILRLSEHLLM